MWPQHSKKRHCAEHNVYRSHKPTFSPFRKAAALTHTFGEKRSSSWLMERLGSAADLLLHPQTGQKGEDLQAGFSIAERDFLNPTSTQMNSSAF